MVHGGRCQFRSPESDGLRHYYVLSKLDATTLRKLSAFLKRDRGPDPYKEIRARLCRTYEPPLEQKIDTLLATKDMGDEKPIEFALELQRLAAEATVDDFLKRIFLRSLPPQIATAIRASRGAKLESLAEAADDALATAAAAAGEATVAAISGPKTTTARRGRGRRQRGGRAPASGGQIKTLSLCSFHQRFGDSAKKCSPGCARWGEKGAKEEVKVFHVEEGLDGEDEQEDTAQGNA